MKKSLLVLAAALVILMAGTAMADTVTLTNGSVTAVVTANGSVATLQITSGTAFANTVAIHVADGAVVSSGSVSPSGGTGWTFTDGQNSNQCDGTGNWFCAYTGSAPAGNGSYVSLNGLTFTFNYSGGSATDLFSAQFQTCASSAGCTGKLFSVSGAPNTQTPEPASLALLSAGLIGLGGMIRRRK